MVWRERAPCKETVSQGPETRGYRAIPTDGVRLGSWEVLRVPPAQEPAGRTGECGLPWSGVKAHAGQMAGGHSHPADREDLQAKVGRSSGQLFPGRVTTLKIC